jgi:hypothetical protein
MKTESMVLTDNQMTNLIHHKIKGDAHHKDAIRDEWLVFSYQTWQDDLHITKFIEKINKWLSHQKLSIQVTNFTRFDEEEGDPETVEWEVQITTHD